MSVRAKFFVQQVSRTAQKTGEVQLNVVCRGEDNKEWAAYTPSGSITMTILNESAFGQFEPGDEYFVDFTPAPKGVEGME